MAASAIRCTRPAEKNCLVVTLNYSFTSKQERGKKSTFTADFKKTLKWSLGLYGNTVV